MKKLDKFVLKSFGIMFIGTFFICLFIFVMQFLWLYVDEMVGKGLGLDTLGKFFYYATLTLVPKSLPLALLLAALMTFGNFGERVELTAMKAAGIPLIRVMRPLIVFSVLVCVASFYFQNVTIPHAQLKLQTLLISMKQKSPELEIPEGAFYDGITGHNLYVKTKDPDTGMLYGVIIYDMSDGFEDAHIIKADSGLLQATADKNYLMMTLYDGEQFENFKTDQVSKKNIPYRREVFGKKTLLIEFNDDFSMMDGSLFSANAANKNMIQLAHDVDSLQVEQDSVGRAYFNSLQENAYSRFKVSASDSTRIQQEHLTVVNMDSVYYAATRDQQLRWRTSEKNKMSNLGTETTLKSKTVYVADKNIRKHRIEWWNKIVLSLSCLVFFFIGAPLGAIIRKGGLGVSILVSVIIFIIYYVLDTSGAKQAREGVMTIWFGRWLSTIVLAPLGIFFTWKSNNDSTVFNKDLYLSALRWLIAKPDKRHVFVKEVVIEDTDYAEAQSTLDALDGMCSTWLQQHETSRMPSYKALFFSVENRDALLEDIVARLETMAEDLGNSRDAWVLDRLSHYPIVSVYNHLCPLPAGRLSRTAGYVVPVGALLWLRAAFFTHRRKRDLHNILTANDEMRAAFVERKLIKQV